MRWLWGIVVTVVLTSFAFFLVTGDFFGGGPVLLSLWDGRGVHSGDLFVLGGWLVGVLAAGCLVAAPADPAGRSGRRPSP